ncbi:MFS transporter [Streptomyces sp. NPDC087263]|uniref:MFS transporter n=1 Tax=Streptomyces sp. NPDC087263 TaxID=3365773 RepID=UPI00381AFE3E
MSVDVQSPPKGSLLVLALAATAYALAQTAVVPAMTGMTEALHASSASVTWVLTGYLVSAAILTPVIGRLGDMFGKRRMLLIALVLFGVGAVLAAVVGNIWLVVAARVLQGAGGGIFPLCFGIISDDFPPNRRAGALGLISAIAGIGAGAGLLLGGLLIDHASYQWIFWSGAIMAGLAMLGVRTLPAGNHHVKGKVDYAGAVLLAVGVTAPLIALTKTADWGWTDARVLGLIAAGLLVLVLFGLFEQRVREPLVDMSVLGRPPVLATNIATVLAGFAMFGAFVLIPQLAETPKASGYGLGMDATHAGLLLLPACLMMLVAGAVCGKLSAKAGGKVPLALGMLTAAAGLGLLAAEHGSVTTIVIYSMIVFAGIGMAMAAMPNLIVGAVPRSMTGQATGVNALIRSLGSSIGSQVAATLLAGSVTAGMLLPTDHAFGEAFAIGAVAAAVAGAAALLIPRTRADQAEPVADIAPSAVVTSTGAGRGD